jgi:hypothetical protein
VVNRFLKEIILFIKFDFLGFLGTTLDINLLIVWIMLTCNSSCGLYTWYNRWKNRKISSSIVPRKV